MHRDILIVRNKTTNYNYWYIFHKPLCWAHADYSPLKQCCTLSKLVSFSFLQTCDTVICDLKHPTEQQERAKTFTSPSSCHPTLLHNVTLTVVRPPTRYFITLLTLLSFQWHTYFYLHDAIASFFLSRDGPEARAWQRNRSSADINILMEVEVLFEHLRWRSLHWLQHQVSNSDAFSSWWVKCF